MSFLGYSYDYVKHEIIEQYHKTIPNGYKLIKTAYGYVLEKEYHGDGHIIIIRNKKDLLEMIINYHQQWINRNNNDIQKLEKKIIKLNKETLKYSDNMLKLTEELNNI